MTDVLVTCVLGSRSGIDKDNAVNDFVFTIAGPLDGAAQTSIVAKLQAFYNGGAANAICTIISPSIDRQLNKCEMRFYVLDGHLGGQAHGSPVSTVTWSLGTTTELTPLPSEMAIALSFRGDYGSTPEFGPDLGPGGGRERLRARHRGRIYLGPLGLNSLDLDATTKRPFVKASIRSNITAAAKTLMDVDEPRWGTWSRKNSAVYPLVECWVDDAFDVQRRRGEDPIVRTSVGRTD